MDINLRMQVALQGHNLSCSSGKVKATQPFTSNTWSSITLYGLYSQCVTGMRAGRVTEPKGEALKEGCVFVIFGYAYTHSQCVYVCVCVCARADVCVRETE